MLSDLRFALRLIVRAPGFSLIVVVALGVGLGLSTAIFNAFSAVMLRPVPHVVDEHRVVYVDTIFPKGPGKEMGLALPDFLDLRERAKSLTGFTLTQVRTYIVGGGDVPERVLGSAVSAGGFAMFGVVPEHGRLFGPDDEKPGAPLAVLLSHRYWERRFGGNPEAVGQSLPVNGRSGVIVGVMPPGWNFQENSDLWTPNESEAKHSPRGAFMYPGYARLASGATLEQAQAELAAISAQLEKQFPETNTGVQFRARLLRDEATAETAVLMRLMLGAVLFVLLIACANVANLLLTRGATRTREIAIRVALGATRGRIVRLLLVESLAFGLLGGAAGLLFAIWSNQLMLAAIPVELPFWVQFDFDWRVFAFALGAAVGSAALFGTIPALQVARTSAAELKEGGRTGSAGPRALRLRHALVVLQVALALVLLVGAGLMVRSFLKIRAANPGFDRRDVLTFRVGLPPMQYEDAALARRFFEQLVPRLRGIPGVAAAGAVSALPGNGLEDRAFAIEGRPKPANLAEAPLAVYHVATPGYLAAMGVPLHAGRDFSADDRPDRPRVVLVDDAFARRWFPGEPALGRRINLGEYEHKEDWAEIVGIVGELPQRIGQDLPPGAIYTAAAQEKIWFMSVAVRTALEPPGLVAALQDAVVAVQKDIPIYNVMTLEESLRRAYWERAFFGKLFSAFGVGALLLASLGIYGVMAYAVTQRTQEIGVRMALGAEPRDVVRLVSRQGFVLVCVGMMLGLGAALGLTHFMAGYLYGVSPRDPPTYFSLSLVLGAVGLLATWLPARRATRIAPIEALRAE